MTISINDTHLEPAKHNMAYAEETENEWLNRLHNCTCRSRLTAQVGKFVQTGFPHCKQLASSHANGC